MTQYRLTLEDETMLCKLERKVKFSNHSVAEFRLPFEIGNKFGSLFFFVDKRYELVAKYFECTWPEIKNGLVYLSKSLTTDRVLHIRENSLPYEPS